MGVLSCNWIRIVPHDALFTHLYLGLTILIITKANCDLGPPLQDTANKTIDVYDQKYFIFIFAKISRDSKLVCTIFCRRLESVAIMNRTFHFHTQAFYHSITASVCLTDTCFIHGSFLLINTTIYSTRAPKWMYHGERLNNGK